MNGAVLSRGRFHRRHFLHVIRNDHAGYCAFRFCNSNRAINQMPYRRGRRCHMHVLVRDVFEQRSQIDFLLVIATNCRPGLLADDRYYRRVVHFRVVKSI